MEVLFKSIQVWINWYSNFHDFDVLLLFCCSW